MPKPRVIRHEVVQPLDQSYRFIALTKGQTATVDVADFDWLSTWPWHAHWNGHSKTFYARSNDKAWMHRLILACRPGEEVDHQDGNTLNNRRYNLRKSTRKQNGANRPKQVNNTSGFKGVTWYKRDHNWQAQIEAGGKYIYLGRFPTKEEAARAYDAAAKIHHGAFACPNFHPASHHATSPKS